VEYQKEIGSVMLPVRSLGYRHVLDNVVKGISTLTASIGLFFLCWILYEVLKRGVSSYDLDFFTKLPTPPGISGGGLANAIVGTVLITILATVLGTPLGILAGVYLAEFGKGSPFAAIIRFVNNVLIGVPSIIVGVFAYTLIVAPMKSFSAWAGVVALAIIMLPVITRTTEDMLNMVPAFLRESGLALGAPKWKVTTGIVFRAARSGILTGVLLAVARISGETAPLLFTVLNNPYWIRTLKEPIANLTVTIFNYAMSPYSDWIAKAWGASLLIMVGVLALAVFSRFVLKSKETSQ
jgi:phosphate transport system permease protein